MKMVGVILWRMFEIAYAAPMAIGMCVGFAAARVYPHLESLLPEYSACRSLSERDARYSLAWESEWMLCVAKLERLLGFPTGLAIGLIYYWLFVASGSPWFLVFGAPFGFLIWAVMATTSPRITCELDFRPPILVLRSGTNRELVKSMYIPHDDTGPGGRTSLLWLMGNQLWNWPRLVYFLNEETLNDDGVFAIQLRPSDESWEEVLKEVVGVAWFIVVIPGATRSCIRELRLLVEWEVLDKVIVAMPPERGLVSAAEEWNQAADALRDVGFAFPKHESDGLFYVPNINFSPAASVTIGEFNWTRMESLLPKFSCLNRSLADSLPCPYFEDQLISGN